MRQVAARVLSFAECLFAEVAGRRKEKRGFAMDPNIGGFWLRARSGRDLNIRAAGGKSSIGRAAQSATRARHPAQKDELSEGIRLSGKGGSFRKHGG